MNFVEQKNEVQVLTDRNGFKKKKKKKKSLKLRKTFGTFGPTTFTELIDSNWNAVCYISQQSIFHFLTWMLSGKVSSPLHLTHLPINQPVIQYTVWKSQNKIGSRTLNCGLLSRHAYINKFYWFSFRKLNFEHCFGGHTKFETNAQTDAIFRIYFSFSADENPEHNNRRRLFSVIAKPSEPLKYIQIQYPPKSHWIWNEERIKFTLTCTQIGKNIVGKNSRIAAIASKIRNGAEYTHLYSIALYI